MGPRKPRCPTSPFSPRAPAMPSRPGWPYGKRTAWFGTRPCPLAVGQWHWDTAPHRLSRLPRRTHFSLENTKSGLRPWGRCPQYSQYPPQWVPSGFPALSLPSARRGRVPRGIPWSPSRPARPSPPASRNVGHGDADVPGSPQPCVSPCPPQPRTFSPGVPCSPLSPLSPSEPFGPRSPCRGGGRGMGSGRCQGRTVGTPCPPRHLPAPPCCPVLQRAPPPRRCHPGRDLG